MENNVNKAVKRLMLLVMVLTMFCGSLVLLTKKSAKAAESGTWGSLNWKYSDYVLTITGSGEMNSESWSEAYPWNSYISSVREIVIGDNVTTISSGAFDKAGNLKIVTIGSKVTTIGYEAFKSCSNLSEINFATSSKLTEISTYAFAECANLKALDLPNNLVTIGDYAFDGCSNLKTVEFGNKLVTIKQLAFRNCSQLSNVTLPASIRTIEYKAFSECINLVNLEIPYGIKTIDSYAFERCINIKGNIKIPGTVTTVGQGVFYGCSNIESVSFYAACAVSYGMFEKCSGVKTVVLGSATTGVDDMSFYKCTSLKSLTIGNNVGYIGSNAFKNCSSLQQVNIPASVKTIDYSAFEECTSLNKVTFAVGLVSIGQNAFRGTAITSIKLPSTVTSLGNYVFCNCKNLTSATLGSGIIEIPYCAFSDCSLLETVKLGNNVTLIANQAFYNCSKLSSINWPENMNAIGNNTFKNCSSLKEITLPSVVNTIGSYAFENCTSLKTVTIMSSVNAIEYSAFYGCSSLQTFKTYSMNTTYGYYAFKNCPSLTIYGWDNSSAQTYATSENIPFVKITTLDTPTNKKIINVVSGTHVYWNTVPGAESYTLYRSTSENGTYSQVKANIYVTHFIDTTAKSGQTYYYKVKAVNGDVVSSMSAAQKITYVGTPDITGRFNKAAGISLTWDKITGATGYAIYRKPYNGSTWSRVATINGNSTFTWIDESVKNNNGTVYKYTIRALAGSDMKTLSGCRNTGRTMARLTSQTLKSAAKTAATSIKCTWTTSSQVTGYEVRFMVGSSVYKTVTIGNYKTGVKTFTSLPKGKTYKIQVRSYKKVSGVGSFYSAWSTAKNVTL